MASLSSDIVYMEMVIGMRGGDGRRLLRIETNLCNLG